MALKLLDFAHYTKLADAHAVDADGVILKATQGDSFMDPSFKDKAEKFINEGKVLGAYHFMDPRKNPVAQADWFAGVVKSVCGDLPLILALDIEWLTLADGSEAWKTLSPDDRGGFIFKFLWRMQKHYVGLPWIYTSEAFWKQFLPGVDMSAWPLWDADYASGPLAPRCPAPWKGAWTAWQKTDKDKEPGLIGYADLDEFNGNMAKLKSMQCVPV